MRTRASRLGRMVSRALTHAGVFICCFLIFALLWHVLIDGVLYYSSDSAPILNFFPPFVRASSRDYYILPPFVVYVAWLFFWGSLLLLTWIAARSTKRWLHIAVPAAGALSVLALRVAMFGW